MDRDEYRSAVTACVLAARMLAEHDLPAILAAIEHADNIGPFVDPTLWQKKHKAMDEDRELVRAAISLRLFAIANLLPKETPADETPPTP